MKWYGIVAILVLIFGLAGIVYLGMNTDKIGFSEPNYISKQTPNSISQVISQINKADPLICKQWERDLIIIQFKKNLSDPALSDYPEYQRLLGQEYEIGQKIKFRCE